MKPPVSECVLSAVTMVVGTGDAVGCCDSKTAPKTMLSWCRVTA